MTHSEQLYNSLLDKGYTEKNIGDRDTFLTKMQDKENRRKLYDFISKRGDFRIGNYENYEQRIASDFSIPQPMQENIALAMAHPMTKVDPALRTQSTKPTIDPNAMQQLGIKAAYTFDDVQPIAPASEVIQRNNEANTPPLPEGIGEVSRSDGGVNSLLGSKKQDPIQQAAANDLANRAYNQEVTRDRLNSVAGMRDEAKKKIKERAEELRNSGEDFDYSQWQQSPSQYGYAPMTTPGVKAPNLHSDREMNLYRLTIDALDEAQQHMETALKNQSRNGFQQFGAGVGDALFDLDTLTLGLTELSRNATLLDILNKVDRDEQLTEAEEALLNATLYKQFTESALPNSRWYSVGQMLGENVPYMIEFALSGGAANAITGGASKAILKHMANVARKASSKTASKFATKAINKTYRGLGRMVENTIASSIAVPLKPSLYNNFVSRQIGTPDYTYDQDGNLQYNGRIGALSPGEAFKKAYASSFITNMTESLLGEGLSYIFNKIGGISGKGISKGADIISSKSTKAASAIDATRRFGNRVSEAVQKYGLNSLAQSVGYNGAPAEFVEEMLEGVANALVVGDQSLNPEDANYVFDKDGMIDTAIVTGITALFMGGAASAASVKVRHDVNKAYALAERNILDFGRDKETGEMDEALQFKPAEIKALNDIAINTPTATAEWVTSISRTMHNLALQRKKLLGNLSNNALQVLSQEYRSDADMQSLTDEEILTAAEIMAIDNQLNNYTLQRDYVVAAANYNALIKGLKESVAPQAEAVMADIQANALRDSDYTIKVKFKGQDGYLVSGIADINDLPDGRTEATLPAGNIYQVRTKSPDGQWIIQQAVAEDILPGTVTPTQQLIDETTARIYTPVQNLINAEQAQAQAEVAQAQPSVSAPASDSELTTPPLPEGIGEVSPRDGGVDNNTPSQETLSPTQPTEVENAQPSAQQQDLTDEKFDEYIATLSTSDAINAITQRRGAEEADQYAQWRKGILTKERDKAKKAFNAKVKPFDASRYTDYAQMKREERKYNEALQATRSEALGIINRTTAEIADIDTYLAERNRQIAAEREAENPLRNGIAQAVEKQPINTLEQYIARYIALGGRLRMTDQYTNGLAAELGITPGSQEHRELLSILSNTEGMTPEQLAQDMAENIEPEYRHLIAGRDTQDIRNAIIDTIQSGVTSRKKAYDFIADINQRAADEEQRYIDEQELQAEIDADTEQAIREYKELLLSSLTPDDLAIIETMAGDYWDEILAIQQYEQEAYNDYDTNSTSTTPRNTQRGAESRAIQSSTQPSKTTSIRQDSQGTTTNRPATTTPTHPRTTPTNNERGASQENSISQEKEIIFLDPRQMSDAEKQRRGDMLRNSFAIEVQKNIITSTPDISARKAAEKWWDENVAEPVLYNTEVGEVEINKNSVESSLAHRYGQKKLDAITSLIEGFENAVYLGTMEDGTRQEDVLNHYFAYPIVYDGELNYVFCRAMQDANKNRLYVHEVFLGSKIKKGDTLQTAASQPHGGISLYRDILANVLYDKDTSSSSQSQEINEEINRQITQAEATGSYTITPTQYTTKRGNVLDMQLVKFANDLTKEQYRTAKELAKADKGWYDREQGGFMMRSQESAQQLVDAIASQPISMTDIKALNDGDIAFTEPQQSENKPNAPIWQYSIHVDTDGYTVLTREDVSSGIAVGDAHFSPAADSPEEMLEILRNPHNNLQEVLDAVGVILENKIKTRELDRKIAKQRKQEYEALRANGVNGYKIGEKVIYKGKEATIYNFEEFGAHRPVLDTGMAPVIYEVAEWSDIEHLDKDKSRAGFNAPEATNSQEQPANQGQFGLVSDDRMAELKERLRRKLGAQMNIGIDPEILSIGLEIAVGHIDRGIKSFTDFARVMINDLGDTIRPYLKAFYNGARDLPEVIDNGLATDMTPYDEVQQFDITNFDRTVPDLTATATNIAREAEVANEVNIAKQRIKRTGEKKKTLPSPQNQLNLFDNPDNNNEDAREQDTRTNNSRTQPRREELPETESVEPRTPLQHTVEIGRSKRGNTRTSGNQLGDRPLYDVNKNYSNEEISQIVSSVTDIVDGRVVITTPITDDIRAICHQYKSGGVAKKGHGILDEYYTDGKIVDAVSMLITPYFNNSNAIRVLEPSVGVGNFISAVDNIPTSEIVTFEINPTTARIAKILYPGIDVNLRSFETEFIDDAGNKKPLPQKYNLIIGNPPYGSHRGLYKGLGEESKIARYEDYFVKRSLDVLNEGGVLAMVLPSSWIDRHTRYGGYTIEAAYRLPSGAFEATQVGTDIVVLRKDSSIPTAEHTPYFQQYSGRILGEVKQRKGRYGKMEDYVQGDIDSAIEAIKRDHAEQLANHLDIAPSNDNLNNIEDAIDETGSLDKATAIVQTAKDETNNPVPANNTTKKSKYKTELNRGVETVPTSLQFSHQFSEGEVEAFYDTEYDGTINHPSQHRKYANYIGGRAMHDFYYAEGDIYAKLDQLEREKENIIATYGQEQYDKQKRLLMSVLPKRKGLSEITISPNTTFVKNLYIDTDKGSITLRDAFIDFCSKLPYQAFGDSSSWEVRGYVNNEQVYGQDKERNALVRERRKRVANDLFVKFLNEELSQPAQNQVVAAFNREYNSTYRPDYSRVPMFSTINKDFRGRPLKLTSVQLAGIGRMTVKGVGVLAHEVGFGKTLSGILAMHEAMTRGFATKPLVVVPNDNILKQWVETIKEVLPQATVNTLGNLGTSYDLTDFKVNDGEFTLVTYEGLKAMSFSDDTYNRLAERFSYITEDLKKHQSERDIQKEIEKKQELKGRMKRGAKTSYGFEDFGFDWLTVDEVHNCNHIVSKVRLDKSVSSDFRSQNQRTSDLGLKTWLAAQYIQEENNGRNVLLLSATPFTNKPLEYYSILSLVGNKMLKRKGFFHVDQFFSTFMEADNELEIGANGRPTQKTNVRRFRNNGLFQQLLSEFIDIKGEEDNPELVRPDRHNREYKINPNELTEDAMAAVQDLLNDNDTVLQGIGHARAAAFSPYATSLLGIRPKNHREFVKNSPKINTTIKLIEQNKKDRPDAGQIIYSEVGVEFFPMIRDYLVNESGFKPSEVRIITGATSNAERVNIQSAFNKGDVKVVIGSPAIKEGLNLQENTTDMYILSLPWNFTQLRQIEGRGWRQGNKWENIRINYMLTNNSVDVFMLQRLQLKQGLYNEAMKKGAETLDVSDIDTSELKTALITDPAVRAEIVTKQEREKLEQQRTQIEADLSFVLRKYESYNKLIEKLESKKKEINQFKEWAAGGNSYWADRLLGEENKLNAIVAEIQEEKERLQKKGVNVDEIEQQTSQAQNAIEDINQKIENLKEYQEELTDKYRREQELKQQQQGDLLATYIKERKAENNSGSFYKIRPKENADAVGSHNDYKSLKDYARAVVKQYNTTTASTDNNRNIGKETLGITNKHNNFTEIATEIINNIASTYNLSPACGITAVVNNADDVEYMQNFLGEEEYNIIKKRFNEPFVSGVSIPERNFSVVFPTKALNIDEVISTWFHETTHILYQKLSLEDKNEYGLTALQWLKTNYKDDYKNIVRFYKQEDWADEATATLVEKLVKDGNIELFLNADFTGNEKLSKLATALQNLFKYGEEAPKDSIRFQQTDRSTNQLSDKDITSTSKTTLRHSNQGWGNTYRRGVGRDATQSSTRQQGVGREVFEDARVTFEFKLADNRTADTALDTIEQATTDYADSLNAERIAIIDAITPKPDDSLRTIAEKTRLRSIGSELVTRDNTELEDFLALANKISNAMAENDARHKHTAIAESQYDSMQRLHNLIDDLREQGALIDERFDPWLTQNQSRSRAQAETKVFDLTYRQPLYKAIARGIRALFPDINTKDKAENAKGYSHLSLYAQARTAVERQAIKSAQARAEAEEKGEEYKEKDFGGLAGIQEAIFGLYSAIDDKVEAAKGNIEKLTALANEQGIPTVQEYIDNAEAKLGNPDTNDTAAHQLWTAIRSISAYQLTYSYNAGLVSRSGYQTLTYGRNIDALLRERYNMQVQQIKDNPGSYDNVTDYDKDGNATGKRMVLNDNARIALNKLNQEYAEAIDAVPMPGKNGNWQQLIDTGWLTEEDVNSLHRYYMYYMPLKGHAELTAEDIVDYENKTPRNQSKIKAVEGHSHLAKDPFNQLILDTHGAIQNAEQNRWRLNLYNILTNNPNSSQYVVEQRFYKIETKSDGSKEYVPYGTVETINGVEVLIPGRPTAEELANGTAVSYNNRFTRAEVDIPIRNDQRKEHSVTVMVDGEAYTIFFYDKRIADAINGTNIKRPSDWWKQLDKLQALNRLYAGLKTSLNPTFTLISNLPRDWMEMVSNNFIEHGLAHAVTSFIYRVRATRAGDVQAALRKYQEGKLLTMADATSDVERYVVEFFNNGGSVNITQLPDYNTAKVELMDDLNTYMRTGQMPKGSAWARGFNNMAERVELAPRLATYIASRTLGRNISQSVNDAKEATVNFDRKGSWSGIMGMFQLFYNAAAQSVRRQIGLARRHPVRFAATYATIGFLSPLNSIMASYISSLLLGDDDDIEDICRKYFAINPELRRRYFIILFGDDYIRIPMAVNYLPYVTLGDVIANWRLNPNYRPNVLKDTLDIASATLDTFLPSMIAQPIGFFFDTITAKNDQERAQAFISLFGSAFNRIPILEPLGQSLANYNFMGGTLFDRPFDKNSQEPAYLRARQYTQPVWVWASHLLNDITGGNEVHAGWLNIAPEQIENVMTVFGGYGEYAENIISLGIETVSILSGEKPDTEVFKKSFPLLSRLYGGNTQERYDKSMQSMFYDDTTALAQYNEYRKNATTASTRADFDRTYSPDEQRYFADLNTMESIAKKIRKEIKDATPEGEAPKYHSDERLKAIYNLANEQYHSLASGEYKPIDNPYYTYMYIKDAIEKAPHRTADGTYRLIDRSERSADSRGHLKQLLRDFSKTRSKYNALPSGYYPGMSLDNREEQALNRFNIAVGKLMEVYRNTDLDNLTPINNAQ